jgi:aryl-alcohol dehydrogenase-like predicted oxidoreductase
METRSLGSTGLQFTTIGLGTWAIGGSYQEHSWGSQDDGQSIATIRKALDLGVNWIDTAPAYGRGHAEEVVGHAIKGLVGPVYLATKCGIVFEDDVEGRATFRLKARSIRAEVEKSLRRLGVDVIDLYQIHWPRPDGDIEEGWVEIARLVEEGKIRYAGVSNFSVSQIQRIRGILPVASVQVPYSMLRRAAEAELFGFCASAGMGVVCYSPMQSGLLTGKLTHETISALPSDDWRRSSPHFKDPELAINLTLIERLRAVSKQKDCSLGQLAVAWVLSRPEVTAAIVGARRPAQVEENMRPGKVVIGRDDMAAIETMLNQREDALSGVGFDERYP